METDPTLFAKIVNPEIWTPTGERKATQSEIEMLGAIALNDNIILGED